MSVATVLDIFSSNIIKTTVPAEKRQKIVPGHIALIGNNLKDHSVHLCQNVLKNTLLMMYSEIIEDSKAGSSNSADEAECILSELLVVYKVGSPFT